MVNVRMETANWNEGEKLRFEGNGYRSVHRMFGESMAMIAKVTLNMMFLNVGKVRREAALEESGVAYKNLLSLSKSGLFEIEGVNYLKRFVQAFEGYCEGVGISYAEGALLQIVEEVGCQTVVVKEKATGEVRLIHTEEDPSFDAAKKGENYFYRWVEMVIDGRELDFFAYPGLCSFGPAFGVNKTMGMVQMVDDLYVKEIHSRGILWANAVAFMTLDAGDMKVIKEIVKRISLLPGEKFTGGYAIHMIKAEEMGAEVKTVEFGGDKIVWVKPVETEDRLVVAQSNYAKNKIIQRYVTTFPPAEGQRWSQEDAEIYVEMRERYYRLEKMGVIAEWLGKDAEGSIAMGEELLARPEGDIGRSWSNEGRASYYYTGLPSKWVAGHLTAYVSRDEVVCLVSKLLPKPIKGKEYVLKYKRDYEYAKNKLWELAEKERRIRYRKPMAKFEIKGK